MTFRVAARYLLSRIEDPVVYLNRFVKGWVCQDSIDRRKVPMDHFPETAYSDPGWRMAASTLGNGRRS